MLCSTASGIATYAFWSIISSFCSVRGICCSRDRHSSGVEQPSHCLEARVLHGGGMEFCEGRQWHDRHAKVHIHLIMVFSAVPT